MVKGFNALIDLLNILCISLELVVHNTIEYIFKAVHGVLRIGKTTLCYKLLL